MGIFSNLLNETIRTIWDKEEEKYYISIIDIVGVISKSNRPRKYWSDLKNNLIKDGFEVSEKIGQLKLKSQDGKYQLNYKYIEEKEVKKISGNKKDTSNG